MAVLTVQQSSVSGSNLTFGAADVLGDSFLNVNEKTFIIVKNTNIAVRNVTINAIGKCDFGFDHDVVVVIPAATGEVKIGPFMQRRFNDGTQKVNITYDAVTDLTIAAVSM